MSEYNNVINIGIRPYSPDQQQTNLQANRTNGAGNTVTQTLPNQGTPQAIVDEIVLERKQAREEHAKLFALAFAPLPPRPQEPDIAKLLNIDPAADGGKADQRRLLIGTLTSSHMKHGGGAGMDEIRALDASLESLGKITSGAQYQAIASELFQKYAEPVRRTDDFWGHGGTNGILQNFRREVDAKIAEIKKPFMQEFNKQTTAYNDAAAERNRALQALGMPTYDLSNVASVAGITQPQLPASVPKLELPRVTSDPANPYEMEEPTNPQITAPAPLKRSFIRPPVLHTT